MERRQRLVSFRDEGFTALGAVLYRQGSPKDDVQCTG